jgi:hypothetical protein
MPLGSTSLNLSSPTRTSSCICLPIPRDLADSLSTRITCIYGLDTLSCLSGFPIRYAFQQRTTDCSLTIAQDGSFTLTLFLPFASLDTISTREDAAKFFNDNFPSAVKIVGEERLLDDFEKNPRGNLVTINATPSSWQSHGLLLGDSSHSMVP